MNDISGLQPFSLSMEEALYSLAKEHGSGRYRVLKKGDLYCVYKNEEQIDRFSIQKKMETKHSTLEIVAELCAHIQRTLTGKDIRHNLHREIQNFDHLKTQVSNFSMAELPKPLSERWYKDRIVMGGTAAAVIGITKDSVEIIFKNHLPFFNGINLFHNIMKVGLGALLYKKAKVDEKYAKKIEDQDAATQTALFQTSAKATFLQGSLSLVSKVFEKLNAIKISTFLQRTIIYLSTCKTFIGVGKAIYRLQQCIDLKRQFHRIYKNENVLSEKKRKHLTLSFLQMQIGKSNTLSRLQRYTDDSFIYFLKHNIESAIKNLEKDDHQLANRIIEDGFINEMKRTFIKEKLVLFLSVSSLMILGAMMFASSLFPQILPSILFLLISVASFAINSSQLERLLPARKIDSI